MENNIDYSVEQWEDYLKKFNRILLEYITNRNKLKNVKTKAADKKIATRDLMSSISLAKKLIVGNNVLKKLFMSGENSNSSFLECIQEFERTNFFESDLNEYINKIEKKIQAAKKNDFN